VFISEVWNRRISAFTSMGEYLYSFNVRGWYQTLGNEPYMAIDAARNLLYVTDPDAGRVLVYTTNGDCVGSFGSLAGENPLPNQFTIAGGILVDAEGSVYVSDAGLGRILKFPPFPVAGTIADPQSIVPVVESTEEVSEEIPLELPAETTEEATPEVTPAG
jgi:DNA-binding beta-propeller fold protein YncE